MRIALLVSLTLFLVACGPQQDASLEWPELKALDMEVEELDGLLAGDPDPAAMAEHLPHVQEALEALFASGIPEGTENPELVEQKLEELKSLATEVGKSPEVLPALHPLVASIMEEAGMPHVHECAACASGEPHDHTHDHDHGEHDHGH